MARAVHVRDALPDDADVLVEMWREYGESGARLPAPTLASARRAIGHLALDPEKRLLLAEVDGRVVGTAAVQRTPVTPIHEETTVRLSHLFVCAEHRRRGVGRALLGAAAAWADEKESSHLMVSVSAAARDANRFLARLGLASVATLRGGHVAILKERLAKYDTADAADGHVMVERIRTLRRRQASARAGRRQPVD